MNGRATVALLFVSLLVAALVAEVSTSPAARVQTVGTQQTSPPAKPPSGTSIPSGAQLPGGTLVPGGTQVPAGTKIPDSIRNQLPLQQQQQIQALLDKLSDQDRARIQELLGALSPQDARQVSEVIDKLTPQQQEELLRVAQQELKDLSDRGRIGIQRFVDERFPPQDMTSPNRPAAVAPFATQDNWTKLRVAGRSVGRVEIFDADWQPAGTAFFVDNGLVATNCHVGAAFVSSKPDGSAVVRAELKPRIVIDGDGGLRSVFSVTGVRPFPKEPGFDVALIEVAPQGNAKAPAPLALTKYTEGRTRIAVVGYAVKSAADAQTTRVFDSGPLRNREVAKAMSAGLIVSQVRRNGYDALVHIASTIGGQSGSPVFDLEDTDLRVVGIHNCCKDSSGPSSYVGPACGIPSAPNLQVNEAISAFGVVPTRQGRR